MLENSPVFHPGYGYSERDDVVDMIPSHTVRVLLAFRDSRFWIGRGVFFRLPLFLDLVTVRHRVMAKKRGEI
jgi:hypothetical protein